MGLRSFLSSKKNLVSCLATGAAIAMLSFASNARADGTRYVCTGWNMTGNDPASGTTNSFIMTATNNAVLNWLWKTQFMTRATSSENGEITSNVSDPDGYADKDSEVVFNASSSNGYSFAGYGGLPISSFPNGTSTNPTVSFPVTGVCTGIVGNFVKNTEWGDAAFSSMKVNQNNIYLGISPTDTNYLYHVYSFTNLLEKTLLEETNALGMGGTNPLSFTLPLTTDVMKFYRAKYSK